MIGIKVTIRFKVTLRIEIRVNVIIRIKVWIRIRIGIRIKVTIGIKVWDHKTYQIPRHQRSCHGNTAWPFFYYCSRYQRMTEWTEYCVNVTGVDAMNEERF